MQNNFRQILISMILIVPLVVGVALFAAMVWLSRAVLGHWHESELGART